MRSASASPSAGGVKVSPLVPDRFSVPLVALSVTSTGLLPASVSLIAIALPRVSCPCTCPRREVRSPMMPPVYSSGVTTSTFMIGSSNTGLALLAPSLKPMEPAILNAISEESTSW